MMELLYVGEKNNKTKRAFLSFVETTVKKNFLSPNIHIQILQTDLYKFP